MCSNCSGDDLSPESFATFDVSSPSNTRRFASELSNKRKQYGTMRIWAQLLKRALTLTIVRVHANRGSSPIIRSVDRASFVNLISGTFSAEDTANTPRITEAAGPIEIRVSADSIVEVYSDAGPIQNARNEDELHGRQSFSSWEESYAERSDLRRAMGKFRRTRRLKYVAAYGAFLTLAAIAVWCVVR
jgi:hypothetical protein